MNPNVWRCLAATICSIAALPAAEFTTYIGNASDHRVAGIVADAAGNTFIAGSRVYAEGALPYSGTFSEVFITKLDSTGKTVRDSNQPLDPSRQRIFFHPLAWSATSRTELGRCFPY